MSIKPSIALLKKDFWLNRVPIFGGTLLVFLPYLIGLADYLVFHRKTSGLLMSNVAGRLNEMPSPAESFRACPAMSLIMMGALAAILGGAAFAYERRERWADFLAMMPVRRIQTILSKTFLSAAVILPIWGINIYIARRLGQPEDARVILYAIGGLLMVFGIAWFLSSFLSSPAIAACISIAVILMYFLSAAFVNKGESMGATRPEAYYFMIDCVICAVVGGVAYVAGMVVYCWRVEA